MRTIRFAIALAVLVTSTSNTLAARGGFEETPPHAAEPQDQQLHQMQALVCKSHRALKAVLKTPLWRAEQFENDFEKVVVRANYTVHDPAACAFRRILYVGNLEFVDRIVQPEGVYKIWRANVAFGFDKNDQLEQDLPELLYVPSKGEEP